MFPQLIALLFFSREYAHRAHLASRKHSEHVILQEFYEELIDLIDSFVESYQGTDGVIMIPYAHEETAGMQVCDVIRRHAEVFSGCRAQCVEGNALNAIADEIEILYSSTVYKLENLL